jgi:protein ImuB
MPFACIFVPDFSLEALLRAEPELRSQPLAVLEGKAPLQKVFAVNGPGRRMGIDPAMAKAQVEACSGLVLRPRSRLQENAAHAALLDCAQSFSPCVEDVAPGTVVLDLAGLGCLFGPLPKIARDLARRASELGLESNVAVAANIGTAIIAARGFSGVTVIVEGKESDQLGGLPVEILLQEDLLTGGSQPRDEIFETLRRWGVRRLRDLAALPEVGVSERLGQQGIDLQRLARGATSRTLVPVELPLVFEEAAELEDPLVLLEPLAFLLNRMLEQLCARLGARALATQELRLELELANGYADEESTAGTPAHLSRDPRQRFHRTLRLPVPLLDPRTFLKLLQLDLKAHPPGAPIVKVRLTAQPASPRAAQSGLFLPPSPEPEKLELTLGKIAGIVGEGKAGSLQWLDTHRRDGFRMQRFAPSEPREKPATKPTGDLVTALRMFRPPVVVTVTMRAGRPQEIICSRRQEVGGEIVWAAGPWRSSGDWWEQQPWARDEWDIAVETTSGITLYRLVRDWLAGRWLVEGIYD